MKVNKKNKENNTEKKIDENALEIVYGNGSEFELDSEVGDYMNDLKPKQKSNKNKKIVIPKSKK